MLVQLAQPGIKRALARTPYFVHRLVTDLKSRCDDTESQIPFFVILLLLDLTTLNSDFEQGNKDTLIDVFDTLVDLVSAREQQEHVKQATASAVISIWNLFNQTDPDLSASFIDSIQRHNNARDFADTILSLLNRSGESRSLPLNRSLALSLSLCLSLSACVSVSFVCFIALSPP
eukprot:GEZU01020196.1.p1 GENE.GEZU01020196.1~~GEZU01020196.1.p1  ORF type:complete len:175 (-),score=20.17 GEZU01020196.1:170-694(-)